MIEVRTSAFWTDLFAQAERAVQEFGPLLRAEKTADERRADRLAMTREEVLPGDGEG